MPVVELFSKEDCHLCEEAKAVLLKLQHEIAFTLEERKIQPGDAFYEEYKEKIPLVFINGKLASKYRVDGKELKKKLQRAAG